MTDPTTQPEMYEYKTQLVHIYEDWTKLGGRVVKVWDLDGYADKYVVLLERRYA